jgi:hypothetical protein
LLAAAFVGSTALAATAPIGPVSGQVRPLLIVTNENDSFALEGRFEGTFSVQAGFVDVDITRASILYLGSATAQQPRLVTTVRIGLGQSNGNQWHASDYVNFATPNKVMAVGETLLLPPSRIRIPVADANALAQQWFVAEMANTLNDPAKPNATRSGVCYAQSRRLIFVDGGPAASPSVAGRVSSQPRSLQIVSKPADHFALQGQFEGTYSIQPGFIEVNLTRASVQNVGSPSDRGPRFVTKVRLALARNTGGRWHSIEYVTFATPNQSLKVGESLQLPAGTIRIPLPDVALSQHWFVAEIAIDHPNPAKPNTSIVGTCYAHSPSTVFAGL